MTFGLRRLPLVVPLTFALAVSLVSGRYVVDTGNALAARILGVGVVMAIALPLVVGSYLVDRRGFDRTELWRLSVWTAAGAAAFSIVALLALVFESLNGVAVKHGALVLVWLGGAGAINGFLTGVYNVINRTVRQERAKTAERLTALIDASPVAFVSVDPEDRVRNWNEAAERIFGWDAEEVVGKPFPLVPDNLEERQRGLQERVSAGERLDGIETRRLRKDGSLVDVKVWSAPVHDSDGDLRETVLAYADITERKQRERQLTRLERAVEATGHAIYMTDVDETITYVNPAFEEITGYSEAEAIGQTPAILSSGEMGEEYYEALWGTILEGEVWHEEVPNERKDGTRYVADQTIAPVIDDGEIDRFVAIQTDVTDSKKTRQELKETRDFLEGALNALPDMFFVIDPDGGGFEYWNDRVTEVTGYSDQELASLAPLELLAERDRERIVTTVGQLRETGLDTTVDATLLSRDGTEIPYEFSARFLTDRDDESIGLAGIGRDISDRKEREATLQATTNRLETIIEASPLAIVALDETGRVTLWNPAAEELFGWREAEVMGEPLSVVPDDVAAEFDRIIEQVLAGETVSELEIRLQHKDGSFVDVNISVAPLPGERDEISGTLAIAADITARKQREQRLTVLTRVLRHNLRNQLDVIGGNGELLAVEVDQDRLESLTEQILDAAEELGRLSDKATTVQNRLAYDQPTEPIDLVALISEWTAVLRERFPNLSLSVDVPDAAWVVANDTLAIAIEQAVENAVVHHDGEDPHVDLTVSRDDDHTIVRVADDGPGLPEPELTVIESGTETALEHGSGLGLWIVTWAVGALGGTLTIEANEPQGTVISIKIPTADAPTAEETGGD